MSPDAEDPRAPKAPEDRDEAHPRSGPRARGAPESPSTPDLSIVVTSPAEMEAAASALAAILEGGEVVALDGELGAGKTVFVRGMADGTGVDPALVSSPTFALFQRYRGARLDLAHADAFRLRSPHELDSTGWSEAAGARGCVAAIEWASRAGDAIPPGAIRISIAHGPVDEEREGRTLSIHDPDPARGDRIRAAIERALAGVPCPLCGRTVRPGAEFTPFCSQRCRSADLGRWLGERYRTSRPLGAEDLEEP